MFDLLGNRRSNENNTTSSNSSYTWANLHTHIISIKFGLRHPENYGFLASRNLFQVLGIPLSGHTHLHLYCYIRRTWPRGMHIVHKLSTRSRQLSFLISSTYTLRNESTPVAPSHQNWRFILPAPSTATLNMRQAFSIGRRFVPGVLGNDDVLLLILNSNIMYPLRNRRVILEIGRFKLNGAKSNLNFG